MTKKVIILLVYKCVYEYVSLFKRHLNNSKYSDFNSYITVFRLFCESVWLINLKEPAHKSNLFVLCLLLQYAETQNCIMDSF